MGTGAVSFRLTVLNRVFLPSITGWTVGRAVFGIRATASAGRQIGIVRLPARDLVHLLDTAALFIGWLWPLRDQRNRTYADLVLRTEVRVVDSAEAPRRNVRRIAECVLVIAALSIRRCGQRTRISASVPAGSRG